MSDIVDSLILDLLEWIGPAARPYDEVMDAWRTSCPRLPVWEEANRRRLVRALSSRGHRSVVSVSQPGQLLRHSDSPRPSDAPARGHDSLLVRRSETRRDGDH